ncbi:DUF202 domain-containing protein [Actinomadura atramentaria]|uniref:DUF202 domain-containing protein n=1 Tax=Actinomadura atramentaria TaxID=1990 RepID=UPI00036D24E1|nr:DUF202 domain-containing protein [Actinomadura atramentaria]
MSLWDRGAQPERTALAWSRTALSLVAVGLLAVRLAPSTVGAALAAIVVCGAAAVLLRRARRQQRRRARRLDAGESVADPATIALTTAVTLALGVVGIVVALG